MQPDQPLYEEMVRRGSRGRWPLRAGGWLRTGGLLGIILVLVLWPASLFFKFSDVGLGFVAALVVMAAAFTAGSLLKWLAYRIALAEGIDLPKFFEPPPAGKP